MKHETQGGMPAQPQRDDGIDAVRGIAIVTMVAAHLAREVLSTPQPMWLRVYGSVAAPLFIMLGGMLVAQTGARKHYPISHYLLRGGMVIAVAVFLDLGVWGLYPFVTFDVLYLIGIAVPLTALFGQLNPSVQTAILVSVLGLAPLLRNLFGYSPEIFSLPLSDPAHELIRHRATIVHQFFLSGWFPVFPWLFFSFLGVRLFQWRKTAPHKVQTYLLRSGIPLMALGLVGYWIRPSPFYVRHGYGELFYPPTTPYVLVASGVVLIIYRLAGWERIRQNRALIELGRCSLLMYVIHLMIIHWILLPLFPGTRILTFLALYLLLLTALTIVALGIDWFKRRTERQLPLVLRFLIGS